jgi:hypothetical protein
VVYINERYRSDDDYFVIGQVSTVYIEVANSSDPDCPNPVYFQLSQQQIADSHGHAGDGVVQIMQDDGVTTEPIGLDGKTVKKYILYPSQCVSNQTQPNGSPIPVKVIGLSGDGNVSIIATQATPPN